MDSINSAVETLVQSSNTLFILMGAIMVFAMHAGFAFLEVGTVRQKNQVNALVKIMTDFGFSAVAYFFVGYWIAYDVTFFSDAQTLAEGNGYELVKFFFLMTFAAAIPAIVSGGIAERARFWPFLIASALVVGFVYPLFEGIIWNGNYGFQNWLESTFGAPFHDFAGSVVVHGVGGWLGLVAVLLLGVRKGRYKSGRLMAFPVKHSVSGTGRMDSVYRLVWLQCYVSTNTGWYLRSGCSKQPDGDGRRYHCIITCR